MADREIRDIKHLHNQTERRVFIRSIRGRSKRELRILSVFETRLQSFEGNGFPPWDINNYKPFLTLGGNSSTVGAEVRGILEHTPTSTRPLMRKMGVAKLAQCLLRQIAAMRYRRFYEKQTLVTAAILFDTADRKINPRQKRYISTSTGIYLTSPPSVSDRDLEVADLEGLSDGGAFLLREKVPPILFSDHNIMKSRLPNMYV